MQHLQLLFSPLRSLAASGLVLALAAGNAHAGDFLCVAFNDLKQSCGDMIKYDITDAFTKRYPVSKYQIVILSASSRYGDGASSGMAMVGIAPRSSSNERSTVPADRYIHSFIERSPHTYGEITDMEAKAVRSAVHQMVEALTATAK